MNIKEEFLANILMMKRSQVKFKQTYTAEIGFNVLYHPVYKDSDKDICFLSNYRLIMNGKFVALPKKAFFVHSTRMFDSFPILFERNSV